MSHCIIDEVIEVKKEKVEVTMKHHQAASNIPAEITHGGGHRCTLELIHRTLPQRWDVSVILIKLHFTQNYSSRRNQNCCSFMVLVKQNELSPTMMTVEVTVWYSYSVFLPYFCDLIGLEHWYFCKI